MKMNRRSKPRATRERKRETKSHFPRPQKGMRNKGKGGEERRKKEKKQEADESLPLASSSQQRKQNREMVCSLLKKRDNRALFPSFHEKNFQGIGTNNPKKRKKGERRRIVLFL